MCECKINSIHLENDAKELIFKMCLPASPFFSVQEAFCQTNMP